MFCKGMKKYLSSYLDGELVTSQREKVERHLSKCADCRKEMESLKGIVSTVSALGSSLPAIEPSPEILSQVIGRISQVPSLLRPQWLTLKSLISGAVLVAVMAGGYLYFYQTRLAKEAIKLEKAKVEPTLPKPAKRIEKEVHYLPILGEDSALSNFLVQSIGDSRADAPSIGQETSLEMLAKGLKLLSIEELKEISMEHPEYLSTGERRPPASGAYQEAARLFTDASRITSTGASDATVEAIKALEKGTLSYHVGGKIIR